MVTLVTTRSRPKPFAWSYSKLKNFETCPKRHYAIDVAKTYKEDEDNDHLKYGNFVHTSIAERVNAERKPLPATLTKLLEPWAVKVLTPPFDKVLVEQQLAITEDLQPTTWFGNDVWFRSVVDVLKINGPVGLAIDWKTGKIVEDSVQLALTAQCVFSHHPEIHALRTDFVWLKEDATTRADFTRKDMPALWAGLLPRVTALKHANDTMDYPPKPNGLCRKWCVVANCPHQGVG